MYFFVILSLSVSSSVLCYGVDLLTTIVYSVTLTRRTYGYCNRMFCIGRYDDRHGALLWVQAWTYYKHTMLWYWYGVDLLTTIVYSMLMNEVLYGNTDMLWGDYENLTGDVSGLSGFVSNKLVGDVSGIFGDVTNLVGDCTGLFGEVRWDGYGFGWCDVGRYATLVDV